MLGLFRRLGRDDTGAIAPTAALSIFALMAMGGVAFDYARLASLDTELQQAADMAALAAATQLDRGDDAQTRATNAITSGTAANRLARNFVKFANDSHADGAVVELVDITFCEAFDDSIADNATACTEAAGGDGAASRYVMVTTRVRTANYSLTPVVGALRGDVSASAVAGVESSICNVAPLLVCTPDADFPSSSDIGRGLVLKPFNGQDAWAPGNYGLLDFGNGNPAVLEALMGFGMNGCQATDDNATEPGTKEVTDAINTRLDVYDPSGTPLACDATTGAGCPAENAGKDMVIEGGQTEIVRTGAGASTIPSQEDAVTQANAAGLTCPASPTLSNSVKFVAPKSPVIGFGRDTCHYSGNCTDGNFGDGNWNATAYFAQNHGGDASGALTFADKDSIADLTRYDVYRWENDDPANMPTSPRRQISVDSTPKVTGGGTTYTWTVRAQCTYSQPVFGSTAYPEQKDRRILPIVAADCSELEGKGQAFEDYTLLRVFDILLTEPSANRAYPGPTDNKEIYGEVIGPAVTLEGGTGYQYYSRNKPYLVR